MNNKIKHLKNGDFEVQQGIEVKHLQEVPDGMCLTPIDWLKKITDEYNMKESDRQVVIDCILSQ